MFNSPSSLTLVSIIDCTSVILETSAVATHDLRPMPLISLATSSHPCLLASISLTQISYPSLASRRAMALPIPRLEPVTIAVLLCSSLARVHGYNEHWHDRDISQDQKRITHGIVCWQGGLMCSARLG